MKNPILVDFRRYNGNAAEWMAASDSWWSATAALAGATHEQLDQARRIISRLERLAQS